MDTLIEKIIQIVVLGIFGIVWSVIISFMTAFIVWPLWNLVMPDIFGLQSITYWQAFGLNVLSLFLLRFSVSSNYIQPPKLNDGKKHEKA